MSRGKEMEENRWCPRHQADNMTHNLALAGMLVLMLF
jgi:hypothetical protein